MASMELLLAHFPIDVSFDTPMASDALVRIRDPVSPANPLMNFVPQARAILGLGL